MATSSATRDYDGTGDYLDTGDSTTYNFTTGDFSFLTWAYPDTATGTLGIANNIGAGGVGWEMATSISSAGVMSINKSGVAQVDSSQTVGTGAWKGLGYLTDNGTDMEWVHIASGTVTTSTTASATNINSSSDNLEIGGGFSAREFNGAMNHTQVFNRLLSVNETQNALYAPGSVTNGLVGYWPGYGQLSPEPDISTTGSNGTVTGTGGTRNEPCPAIPQQMPIV